MASEQQLVKQQLLLFGFEERCIDDAIAIHSWIDGDKQTNMEALTDIVLQSQNNENSQFENVSLLSSIPPDIEQMAAIKKTKKQTANQFYDKMVTLLNNGIIGYGHSQSQIRKILCKEYKFDSKQLKTNINFEQAIQRMIQLMMEINNEDNEPQNNTNNEEESDDDAPLIWISENTQNHNANNSNNMNSNVQNQTISDEEYAKMLQAQFEFEEEEGMSADDDRKHAEELVPWHVKYKLPKDAKIGPFNSITAIKHGRRCYLIRDESRNYAHFDESQLKWTPHPPQTAQSWTSQYFGNDFAAIPKMKKCLRQQIEQRNGMGQYRDHEYIQFETF